MDAKTKKKLLRLMSEHLGVKRSELKDDTPLDDIMDDLDLIELIMAIEEEALALFKEAAEKSANIHLQKTVKGFIDTIAPYLP